MKKFTAVLATAAIALGGVALTALPASAHTGAVSYQVGCWTPSEAGKASVMTKVFNDHPTEMLIESDDPRVDGRTVPARGALTSSVERLAPGAYGYNYKFIWPADGFSHTATGSVAVTEADLTGKCAPVVTLPDPSWSATPATCDAAATIALNPGEGYTWGAHSPRNGMATATTADGKKLFSNGTRYFTITHKLDPILTGEACAGGRPPVIVEEVVIETSECDSKTVAIATTTTTTGWVIEGNEWVKDDPTSVTVETTREMTSDEKRDCTPKPQPIAVVTSTLGEYGCDSTTVTEEVTTTNVGHAWDGERWVLDQQPSDRSKTEKIMRDLTVEEKAELACPVVVAPPVVTPETPPVVVPVSETALAYTGSDGPNWVLIMATIGTILGGAAMKFGPRLLARK